MARSYKKLHIFQRRAANKDVYITYISTTYAHQPTRIVDISFIKQDPRNSNNDLCLNLIENGNTVLRLGTQ